jgi:hypothetical protein
MRRILLVLATTVAIAAASSCGGKREWVIPRSGEGACMCSAVCACTGMKRDDESEKERVRCWDACDCDVCVGEPPPASS